MELKNGMKVNYVFFGGPEEARAGAGDGSDMEISMQPGQAAMVPFAKQSNPGGSVLMWNLGLCEGFELTPDPEPAP